MTHFANAYTLETVSTYRYLILFFIISSLGLPEDASALGRAADAIRSAFKGRNARAATEGRVPEHCTTGACHGNPFRNGPIRSIPQDNIASGVPRVLATLYGACDAARPLNSINMNALERNRHFSTYKATANQAEGAAIDWKKYIPGLRRTNRDVREVTNSAAFDNAGPYAAAKRGKMCRANQNFNVSSAPKTFGFGASGVMNSKGEYDILRCGRPSFFSSLSPAQKATVCGLSPDSQAAIALDCAEFIGAVSVASCKKLHKNQKLGKYGFEFPVGGNRRELSTASMVDSARRGGNSCLTNKPRISPNSSIQPGDIFAGSSAHSIMITKVGPDPLGINKKKGNCDSITYSDFDFDMAHSPSHSGIGPVNSTARAYAGLLDDASIRNPYPLDKIRQMAIVMCKRQTAGDAQSFMNDPKFSLMRHKSSDPACSYPKDKCPKLSGDECADQCGV